MSSPKHKGEDIEKVSRCLGGGGKGAYDQGFLLTSKMSTEKEEEREILIGVRGKLRGRRLSPNTRKTKKN